MRVRPSLLASIGLHVAVIAAGLFVLPATRRESPPGAPVPVTILTEAPPAPAIPAPEPTPPSTPQPELDAPAEQVGEVEAPPQPEPPPAPEPDPAPTPAPPRPTPPQRRAETPAPRPTPQRRAERPAPRPTARPTPQRRSTPPRPTPPREEPSLDLDALAQMDRPQRPSARPRQEARLDLDRLSESLAPPRPRAGARRSSAPQGASRPRAAPTGPQGSAGRSEETALALSVISERLQRTWNPNCQAPGGDQLRVRVTIELNRDGGLRGDPRADGPSDDGSVRGVAVQRAISAVRAAAPFDTLPPERYAEWRQPITINFNAREACRR